VRKRVGGREGVRKWGWGRFSESVTVLWASGEAQILSTDGRSLPRHRPQLPSLFGPQIELRTE